MDNTHTHSGISFSHEKEGDSDICNNMDRLCPRWLSGKEFTCQCRKYKKHVFHPWARKMPGGGHGSQLQYSCLENPMDR